MELLENPLRAHPNLAPNAPYPSTDAGRVAELLNKCPRAAQTPLVAAEGLAPVSAFWIKDERSRMGLGSFKALGAAYVIARQANDITENPDSSTLTGRTFVTASAGNHGMSVAAGARLFGAKAVVYISATVPDVFGEKLRALGADVVRKGSDYAASMAAAMQASKNNGWTLLSDSSWDGYTDLPHTLMEGYVQMAAEAVTQCPEPPTHIFLQAGVGGLAGAAAAYMRQAWGEVPQIIVVEPTSAPALQTSIEARECVFADGPDSVMGRLDCKEPSLIALNGLARDANVFLTLDDDEVTPVLSHLATQNLATTASGGAGVAAAMNGDVQAAVNITKDARILCILSEVAD